MCNVSVSCLLVPSSPNALCGTARALLHCCPAAQQHPCNRTLCSGAKRSGCRLRPRASMGCARTSAQKSGRATSEWRASTNTWAAMTAKLQLPKPLTRRSCCAMSTAGIARTPPLWSPTSRQNTTRQAGLSPAHDARQSPIPLSLCTHC